VTLIAFTGERGSGKSEAARICVDEFGFTEFKFADPLKEMLRTMYRVCGLDEETIERKIEGDLKETPCSYLNASTPRRAMQTLGTEWRNMISPTLWSDQFVNRVQSTDLSRITCSDYRFPHEGEALSILSATTVRIERPSRLALGDDYAAHDSESHFRNLPVEGVIVNDGTLAEFHTKVRAFIAGQMEGRKA